MSSRQRRRPWGVPRLSMVENPKKIITHTNHIPGGHRIGAPEHSGPLAITQREGVDGPGRELYIGDGITVALQPVHKLIIQGNPGSDHTDDLFLPDNLGNTPQVHSGAVIMQKTLQSLFICPGNNTDQGIVGGLFGGLVYGQKVSRIDENENTVKIQGPVEKGRAPAEGDS